MRARVSLHNSLLQRIQNGTLSSRSRWKKRIEDADFEFPELSLEDLRRLFFGTYQIKQSAAYVEEHLDSSGDYVIELEGSDDDILRCTLQSRHSNAIRYKVWIQYSLTGDPIPAWYCQCKTGARTIGSCAHVASIVWYLSYARHNNFTPSLTRRRLKQAILESTLSIDDDTSDDGDETDGS